MVEAPEVSAQALAKLFDLTDRRIHQLAKMEVIPKPVNKRYDLIASVRGYVKFLRKSVADQGSGSSNEPLKKSRIALLETQRKKAELDLAVRAGELVPIDSMQEVVNASAAVYSGQLRSMGSRIASKVAGLSNAREIADLLRSENEKILAAVAVEFDALAGTEPSRSDTEASTKPKPKRVGRRKQGAARG